MPSPLPVTVRACRVWGRCWSGGPAELMSLAEQAIMADGDIVHAPDQLEEHQRGEQAADLITRFARTAAALLRAEP